MTLRLGLPYGEDCEGSLPSRWLFLFLGPVGRTDFRGGTGLAVGTVFVFHIFLRGRSGGVTGVSWAHREKEEAGTEDHLKETSELLNLQDAVLRSEGTVQG